jgi:ABC-type Fe3+ transport system permease subunit
MSLAAPTAIAVVRAACVAALAVALVLSVGPGLRAVPRWIARLLFWATCFLLLIPAMLAGYSFMPSAMKGAPGSLDREAFYGLVLFARFAPVALIAAWHLPPALSPEAMHARLLTMPQSWWRRMLWFSSAWGPGLRIVFGIVFLLVFQEFELATCWNERSWTVAIFDAQAGGVPLATTLRLAALPLAAECVVLFALLSAVRRSTPETTDRFTAPRRASAIFLIVTVVTLVVAFAPLAPLFSQIATSAFIAHLDGSSSALPGGAAIWREAGNSALLSITATLFAWLIAGWVEKRGRLAWLLALPGLLGSLVVGLLTLWLMQLPPLHLLRDTPLPAVGALMLALLPLALLLRRLGGRLADPVAAHTALASDSRRASWPFSGAPHVRAVLLLFCFGYGDFTINALLAPPQFTSAAARILNLMHYGQSVALSSLVATAFAVPLAAALLTAAAARLYARRRVR